MRTPMVRLLFDGPGAVEPKPVFRAPGPAPGRGQRPLYHRHTAEGHRQDWEAPQV